MEKQMIPIWYPILVTVAAIVISAGAIFLPQERPCWDTFQGQLQLSPGMFDPAPLTVPVQHFKRAPAD